MTIDPTAFVHPLADVEDDVTIGPASSVWAGAHLRSGVRVGRDCTIGEAALIDLGVHIGDRCKVQSHALVYHGAQVADDVFIGPAACLTNDRIPRAATPEGRLKAESDWKVEGVILERGASVGACAVIVAGSRVGRWSMIGAGAVVTRAVPPHGLVAGNPARSLGWVCMCGGRLDPALMCALCGRDYFAVAGGGVTLRGER